MSEDKHGKAFPAEEVRVDYWGRIAARWAEVGARLRPSAPDLSFFEQAIAAWSGRDRPPRALILGVTPELWRLAWPAGSRVMAADRTRAMIEKLWPGPRGRAIQADWRALPLGPATRDLVLCDGGLHQLPFPEGQRQLIRSLHRIVAPGGRCIFRLFLPPRRREAAAAVFADLHAGGIPDLNALKLRLWPAMQADPESGVELGQLWEAVERAVPDRAALANRLGWPVEHFVTIDSYRNCPARYHQLDLEAVLAMFRQAGFELLERHEPEYPLGELCPTVVLRRRD